MAPPPNAHLGQAEVHLHLNQLFTPLGTADASGGSAQFKAGTLPIGYLGGALALPRVAHELVQELGIVEVRLLLRGACQVHRPRKQICGAMTR